MGDPMLHQNLNDPNSNHSINHNNNSGPLRPPPPGMPMPNPMGMGGPPMMGGPPPMAMGGPPPVGHGLPPQQQPPPQQPPQRPPPQPPVNVGPPNYTIYIKNINEKIKLNDLKSKLRSIFQQFGKIIDIVAMSSFSRRGQAFVVFDEIAFAKKALEEMQGFPLDGVKPMVIQFAKNKSDTIAKRDGTYVKREKKPLPPKRTPTKADLKQEEVRKRARAAEEADKAEEMQQHQQQQVHQHHQQPAHGYGGGMMHGGMAMAPPPAPPPKPPGQSLEEAPPNSILFLTKLPDDANEMMLTMLFKQFPGFQEVRLVPGRSDFAFVEYENEMQAFEARSQLNGFKLKDNHTLHVNFAKK